MKLFNGPSVDKGEVEFSLLADNREYVLRQCWVNFSDTYFMYGRDALSAALAAHNGRFYGDGSRVVFKTANDALLFELKWG